MSQLIARLLFVAVVICSPLVVGPMNQAAAEDSLAMAVQALADQPLYAQAHWGILAVDLESGEVVLERDSGKLFAPASVTKLFSCASALDHLGASYRSRTPLLMRGTLASDGTLTGDLILRASGDFHLGNRLREDGTIDFTSSDHTYSNWASDSRLTPQDPLTGIIQLAKAARAFGIRKVTGEVLVDDTLFDHTTSSGSGPAQVTPIFVNDNVLDLTITPAAAGEMATIEARPATALFKITSEVTTGASDSKASVQVSCDPRGNVVVKGTIPAGRAPLLRHVEVPSPAGYARALLIEALAREGIELVAKISLDHPQAKLPTADEYQQLAAVGEVVSPPLSESVKLILKVSHNLHASSLPLVVAASQGKRTAAEGMKLEGEFLKRAGVDVGTISFGGGAGGSSADFVTPRATVQLLQYMAKRDDAKEYIAGLPILGVDGTLATAIDPESPARGKVQGKTGTLVWDNLLNGDSLLTSKGLAGYMTTTKGRRLAFALFVNGVHLRDGVEAKQIGMDLARICEMIHAAR